MHLSLTSANNPVRFDLDASLQVRIVPPFRVSVHPASDSGGTIGSCGEVEEKSRDIWIRGENFKKGKMSRKIKDFFNSLLSLFWIFVQDGLFWD